MKMKHMLTAMVLLLGLVLGQDTFAHYNPSTGRWLSRDPILEKASAKFIGKSESADELDPDLNEFQFVGNHPTTSADYLGAGVCKCTFKGPNANNPVDIELGPVIAVGDADVPHGLHTAKCSYGNTGEIQTLKVLANCEQSIVIVPNWCWDCRIRSCRVERVFMCKKGTQGRWKGKPSWWFENYKVLNDCNIKGDRTGI